MIAIEESMLCHAPPLHVWKLLYDPARFSEWWSGVQRSEPSRDGANFSLGEQREGPFAMHIATARESSRIMIRCMATDDLFTWTLEPHPKGCRVRVCIEVAVDDAVHVRARHESLLSSLPKLADVAKRGTAGAAMS